MEAREAVEMAEGLAETLVQGAIAQNLSYADMLQVVELTARFLRATYPGPPGDLVLLSLVTDATFQAVTGETGVWKN
jgi:hypothetical protein